MPPHARTASPRTAQWTSLWARRQLSAGRAGHAADRQTDAPRTCQCGHECCLRSLWSQAGAIIALVALHPRAHTHMPCAGCEAANAGGWHAPCRAPMPSMPPGASLPRSGATATPKRLHSACSCLSRPGATVPHTRYDVMAKACCRCTCSHWPTAVDWHRIAHD